jgi:hypothetical protein
MTDQPLVNMPDRIERARTSLAELIKWYGLTEEELRAILDIPLEVEQAPHAYPVNAHRS